MRKIGAEYENFIDNYLIDICEYMSSYIHKLGITPNIITTLSLICGLSAAALLYNKYYYSACILWIVSYYLDNLDGYIARKYNQTSKIGDYYDHIADSIKFLTALFVLYKLNSHKFYEVSIVLFIFLMLMMSHLGCQESYYNKNESESLSFTKHMCPVDSFENKTVPYAINITKYFGCGTFNLMIVLCFLHYKF